MHWDNSQHGSLPVPFSREKGSGFQSIKVYIPIVTVAVITARLHISIRALGTTGCGQSLASILHVAHRLGVL